MSQRAKSALPPPVFRDAAYGGESVVLGNEHLQLVFHRRVNGWGWGELYVPDEHGEMTKLMAVLEYLGEVDVVGQHYPLRLDAESFELTEMDGVQRLSFDVRLQLAQAPWTRWDNSRCVAGRVELSLKRDSSWIQYSLHAKPQHSLEIRSLRGVWLRVGAESFGVEKHDAIFPGIEWLEGKEWSSGTHNLPQKFAHHVTPHPRTVAFPLMAISHDGVAVGVSWKRQHLDRVQEVQPVFAVPDFVERRDDSLMGLMCPSATWGLRAGSLKADPPISFPRSGIRIAAEIGVCSGTSLDMVKAWIARHGLPDPGPARFGYEEILEKIANAYNTNLWIGEQEKEGYDAFGCYPKNQRGFLRSWHLAPVQPFMDAHWEGRVDFCKRIPSVVERFIATHDGELSRDLQQKRDWCLANSERTFRDRGRFGKNFDLFEWFNDEELRAFADDLLAHQTAEGDFPFDPDGRHQAPHLNEAKVWRPLGQPGDSCLNFCATSSLLLMLAGDCLGDDAYLAAGRKGLDFAMPMQRPEGGDWWETSLHAPNLMTAGYAAMAYYVGGSLFDAEKYRKRAVRFMRSLLPFTTLWETASVKMVYQPKPLFGATAWHAMDWTSRHIMWQILMLFEAFGNLGIDWAALDPGVDWATYQRGITHAGLRWIADHTDPAWLDMVGKEKLDINAKVYTETLSGELDMIVPDNFDPVTNALGGMQIFIAPDTLASNVLQLLERDAAGDGE
jgi:hypothetical protein